MCYDSFYDMIPGSRKGGWDWDLGLGDGVTERDLEFTGHRLGGRGTLWGISAALGRTFWDWRTIHGGIIRYLPIVLSGIAALGAVNHILYSVSASGAQLHFRWLMST